MKALSFDILEVVLSVLETAIPEDRPLMSSGFDSLSGSELISVLGK